MDNGLRALQDFRTGLLETGASMLTSGLAEPVAGIAGLLDLGVRGDLAKSAATVNRVRDYLTYQPRGDVAQRAMGLMGEAMEPVAKAFEMPAEYGFQETGSPAVGAGILGVTQAATELLPGPNPARATPRAANLPRGPDTTAGAPVPTKLGVRSVKKQDVFDHSLGDVDYVSDVLESARLEGIADRLKGYSTAPDPSEAMRMSPQELVEAQVEMQRGNLEWLYERFGNDLGPEILEEAKLWYEGAHDIAYGQGARYGTDIEPVAAVYAALSPQQDWFKNVSLGDRVLEIYHNGGELTFDKKMIDNLDNFGMEKKYKELAKSLKGRKFKELATSAEKAVFIRAYDETYGDKRYRVVTPRGMFGDWMQKTSKKDPGPASVAWGSTPMIEKAVSVLDDPSMENISRQLGVEHKVRNFYNNIVNPWRDKIATGDTHQVAAGQMLPLAGKDPEVAHNFGTGVVQTIKDPKTGARIQNPKFEPWMAAPPNAIGQKGTYALATESLGRAGANKGRLAREMQSITWEAVRSLFKNKSPQQKRAARAVWEKHKAGHISAMQAREMIYDLAGGFKKPAWANDM